MTSDSLDERYLLKKCVAVGSGVCSYHAQRRDSGQIVMVHRLTDAQPDEIDRLRDALARAPAVNRRHILDTLVAADGFVIVTDYLQGFTSFLEWSTRNIPEVGDIIASLGESSVGGPVSIPSASPNQQGSGAARTVAPPAQRGADAAAEPAAQAPRTGPGEFTRVFGSSPTSQPPQSPPQPTPPRRTPVRGSGAMPIEPAAAPAPPPIKPGEFTQLFQSTPVKPAPAKPAHGGASAGPIGGATGAFESRRPAEAARPLQPLPWATPPAAPPRPAAPPIAPASPIASADRLVPINPVAPAEPLPPVLPPPQFAAKPADAGMSPLSGYSHHATPIGGPTVEPATPGPSDYTRLMQSVTPPPPAPTPVRAAPAPVPAAEPARRIPLGLIITLNVVVLVAVGLLLYFVLRPAPPAAAVSAPVPAATAPAVSPPTITKPSVTPPTVQP